MIHAVQIGILFSFATFDFIIAGLFEPPPEIGPVFDAYRFWNTTSQEFTYVCLDGHDGHYTATQTSGNWSLSGSCTLNCGPPSPSACAYVMTHPSTLEGSFALYGNVCPAESVAAASRVCSNVTRSWTNRIPFNSKDIAVETWARSDDDVWRKLIFRLDSLHTDLQSYFAEVEFVGHTSELLIEGEEVRMLMNLSRTGNDTTNVLLYFEARRVHDIIIRSPIEVRLKKLLVWRASDQRHYESVMPCCAKDGVCWSTEFMRAEFTSSTSPVIIELDARVQEPTWHLNVSCSHPWIDARSLERHYACYEELPLTPFQVFSTDGLPFEVCNVTAWDVTKENHDAVLYQLVDLTGSLCHMASYFQLELNTTGEMFNVYDVTLEVMTSSSIRIQVKSEDGSEMECQEISRKLFACRCPNSCRSDITLSSDELIRLCDVNVLGSIVDCERPPLVIGAEAVFNGTRLFAVAEYSCIEQYVYTGGNSRAVCNYPGNWSTPTIVCLQKTKVAEFHGHADRYKLNNRPEVHFVVVNVTHTNITHDDLAVTLSREDPGTEAKTCTRLGNGDQTQELSVTFECHGFPASDVIQVYSLEGLLLNASDINVKVYGRYLPQGKLECKQTATGLDYKGSINFTMTRKSCLMWTSADVLLFPDYTLAELGNNCRNRIDEQSAPFCYTTPDKTELCPVPSCDAICQLDDGRTYAGYESKSAQGSTCMNWNSFPGVIGSGLDGHNFCRNPLGSMSGPWCFIKEDLTYELCDIPSCPSFYTQPSGFKTRCFCEEDGSFAPDTSIGCEGWRLCFSPLDEWTLYHDSDDAFKAVSVVSALTQSSVSTPSTEHSTLGTANVASPSPLFDFLLNGRENTSANSENTTSESGQTGSTETPTTATEDPTPHPDTVTVTASGGTSVKRESVAMTTTTTTLTSATTTTAFSSTEPQVNQGTCTDMIQTRTTYFKRNSRPTSTAPNVRICQCIKPITPVAAEKVMEERRKNLTVDPHSTSAFRRKKTSAQDDRPVAVVSGTSCLAIMSFFLALIFTPDVVSLLLFVSKLLKSK